jgi:UDP-N-acetylglucosamine acyltransferase
MELFRSENIIHPTAILEGNIRMGKRNEIGPYVILRGDIELGDFNKISGGVSVANTVVIGNGNHIYPYASIGALGEMGAKGDRFIEEGKVIIGNEVTIREFACVHSPVYTLVTRIEDHVYLMNKSYIAHDCVIGRGSVLSAGVLLGGHCILDEYVTMGLGATVHQRCHIGTGAMVGMQTPVTRDILPFCTIAGNPARIIGFNRRGADRHAFDEKWIEEMSVFFNSGMEKNKTSENPMILEIHLFLEKHPESLTLGRM